MIGLFARKLGQPATTSTPKPQVHATDYEKLAEGDNQTPDAFVERIPHEGGDVILAPVLDTLRAVLRQRQATLPQVSENTEGAPEETTA